MPVPTIPDFNTGDKVGLSTKLDQLSAALTFAQNPPRCVADYRTAGNLGNGAWSGFSLTEIIDTPDTMHDDVTFPSRITIRTAGRFFITARASFATNGTGARGIQVRKNSGGSVAGGTLLDQSITAAQAAGGTTPGATFEDVFIVGDYIEMFAYQSSGAALAMVVGHPNFYLAARWTAAS